MNENIFERAKIVLGNDYRLTIRHFHETNDPKAVFRSMNGKARKYATIARISRGSAIVSEAKAVCHDEDTPSRQMGARIAGERAITNAREKLDKASELLENASKNASKIYKNQKDFEIGDTVFGKNNRFYGVVTDLSYIRDPITDSFYVNVTWFNENGLPIAGISPSKSLKKI